MLCSCMFVLTLWLQCLSLYGKERASRVFRLCARTDGWVRPGMQHQQ
jgi:hypothetical protein